MGWPEAQIVATASYDGMVVVTRKPRRFQALGVPVWDYENEDEPPTL